MGYFKECAVFDTLHIQYKWSGMRLSVFLLFLGLGCSIFLGQSRQQSGVDSGLAEVHCEPYRRGRDENAPFAVCTVSPQTVTPPFQSATFDGSVLDYGHQVHPIYGS